MILCTKYRYKILRERVAERARDLVRQICQAREVVIVRGAVSPDHIHLLLSTPPVLSPAKLAQYIKGRSSRHLQAEFPELRKRYWGQHMWARGYFCAMVGRSMRQRFRNIDITVAEPSPHENVDQRRVETLAGFGKTKRSDIAPIELTIGKLDNGRNATEMLLQHHRASSQNHSRQIVNRHIQSHLGCMRLIRKEVAAEILDLFLRHADGRW
ncbi:MAG: IS200/IS605 family transposase [Acidobacteriota bacterium]|nr:IS200/IS605 family transposase [Acidobacteriota bacterium]